MWLTAVLPLSFKVVILLRAKPSTWMPKMILLSRRTKCKPGTNQPMAIHCCWGENSTFYLAIDDVEQTANLTESIYYQRSVRIATGWY